MPLCKSSGVDTGLADSENTYRDSTVSRNFLETVLYLYVIFDSTRQNQIYLLKSGLEAQQSK